jgi:hypothetical protein
MIAEGVVKSSHSEVYWNSSGVKTYIYAAPYLHWFDSSKSTFFENSKKFKMPSEEEIEIISSNDSQGMDWSHHWHNWHKEWKGGGMTHYQLYDMIAYLTFPKKEEWLVKAERSSVRGKHITLPSTHMPTKREQLYDPTKCARGRVSRVGKIAMDGWDHYFDPESSAANAIISVKLGDRALNAIYKYIL